MKTRYGLHKVIITALMIYLFIPLAATFLYSVAGKWDHTILPESYTFKWFGQLFHDPRFFAAIERSLLVIGITVVLSVLIMVPTIFIVTVYFKKWERLLQGLAMLPYGIPPVVAAVGLIKIYSSGLLPISGTIWILIGAYFIVILPYMYQGIRNSIRTINAIDLVDAAEILGASKQQAFWNVIFPNIIPGIMVSTLLSFAMLFGEFALANLLVGGQFETIQIYLYQKLNQSGHLTSAVVITYYMVIMLLSWLILKMGKRNQQVNKEDHS